MKFLSDYAKRRDFQDEADPTRKRDRRFTGFPGFRAAGEGENEELRMKNVECRMKNEELRMKN